MDDADGFGLLEQVMDLLAENREAVAAMRRSASEVAAAERSYRMYLAEKMLELRAQNMPAGMVKDIARGDPGVADLAYRLALAEGGHSADLEHINELKREIDVRREQMGREWSQSGRSGA